MRKKNPQKNEFTGWIIFPLFSKPRSSGEHQAVQAAEKEQARKVLQEKARKEREANEQLDELLEGGDNAASQDHHHHARSWLNTPSSQTPPPPPPSLNSGTAV